MILNYGTYAHEIKNLVRSGVNSLRCTTQIKKTSQCDEIARTLCSRRHHHHHHQTPWNFMTISKMMLSTIFFNAFYKNYHCNIKKRLRDPRSLHHSLQHSITTTAPPQSLHLFEKSSAAPHFSLQAKQANFPQISSSSSPSITTPEPFTFFLQ